MDIAMDATSVSCVILKTSRNVLKVIQGKTNYVLVVDTNILAHSLEFLKGVETTICECKNY